MSNQTKENNESWSTPAWLLDLLGGKGPWETLEELQQVCSDIENGKRVPLPQLVRIRDVCRRLHRVTEKHMADDPSKAERLKDGLQTIEKLNEAIYDEERAS